MSTDEALDLALEALEKSLPRLAPYGEQDWLDSKAAITAIKQAHSAFVQEPVAEVGEDMKGGGYVKWLSEDFFVPGTKLYTTPPAANRPWVGLTHEEVMDSWDEIRDGDWAPDFYAVIEAKLKDKNG